MFDLVCNVPKLHVRDAPLIDPSNVVDILFAGQHFQALKFKTDKIDKTRIVWAQNTAGKWAMVLRGQALYFKLAGKPFQPPLG